MPYIARRLMLLLAVFAVAACAVAPKPYDPPVDLPLQDPPAGQAIVYLLRAPYDSSTVVVAVNGKVLAVLPGSTYTAVVVPSGRNILVTTVRSLFGTNEEEAPAFPFDIKPNERRFFNLSGLTAKTPVVVGVLPLPGIGFRPLIVPMQGTASGTKTWKEVAELDAQGLISISSLVLPEKDAL
jgi:hypothetical protein